MATRELSKEHEKLAKTLGISVDEISAMSSAEIAEAIASSDLEPAQKMQLARSMSEKLQEDSAAFHETVGSIFDEVEAGLGSEDDAVEMEDEYA